MFNPGDLVIISDDCDIDYFAGKTALIIQNMGQDVNERQFGYYYRVRLNNGNEHILTHRELYILSRAGKNNENR